MTSGTTRRGTTRRRVVVRGVVQGVGYRPFVVRLAAELGVSGSVSNDSTSVVVDATGSPETLDDLVARLRADAPPLAVVTDVHAEDLPVRTDGDRGSPFVIVESRPAPGARTLVPPDTAVCEACLAEMRDPTDRRHGHPFITCTDCGPRLTIITDLPYDRPATTMSGFAMCDLCRAEYDDPTDRRHHAQPIGCHECGPTIAWGRGDETVSGSGEVLREARAALRRGEILAVKGIGGYHLVCDASSSVAVVRLRERKRRPDQPFAVMARDLETAEQLVRLTPDGRAALTSPARPIVIAPTGPGAPVCSQVAPELPELGVMLPYAPLHHLLLEGVDGDRAPDVLVMTSGNLSGEPLCYLDVDATTRLAHVADAYLTHDRPIVVPCEDSVLAQTTEGVLPVRRSRGYAPLPVVVPDQGDAVVLAVGAELKNTVSLARDGLAFVSAHVGDLGTLESRGAHDRAVEQLVRFHARPPSLVVADQHPQYASRARAEEIAADLGVPLHTVQHHHAHLASLAVEHDLLGPDADGLVGIVLDGTGYGCDETIWGGEILRLGDGGRSAERVGHLATLPLPGGDGGVRNPVRTAAAALVQAGIDLPDHLAAALTPQERTAIPRIIGGSSGWVATSSAGRLFDIVASILGVRHRVTYEAQAAIELEHLASSWAGGEDLTLALPVVDGPVPRLDTGLLLAQVVERLASTDPAALAHAFHRSLAAGTVELATRALTGSGPRRVGLTGGVYQNHLLTTLTSLELRRRGVEPLVHRLVPPNDGGISLGQVAIGTLVAQPADKGSHLRDDDAERRRPAGPRPDEGQW